MSENSIYFLRRRLYIWLRSVGRRDWENCISIVAQNYNASANAAIGGHTPNSINPENEYEVREARKNTPMLDWKQEETNVTNYKERAKKGLEKLKCGDFVYKIPNKQSFSKSFDT